jgi:hypothetical protein
MGEVMQLTKNFKLENQTLLRVNGLIILELIIRQAEREGADSDLTYLTPI